MNSKALFVRSEAYAGVTGNVSIGRCRMLSCGSPRCRDRQSCGVSGDAVTVAL